jgi:hypothetical protein
MAPQKWLNDFDGVCLMIPESHRLGKLHDGPFASHATADSSFLWWGLNEASFADALCRAGTA